MVTMVHKIVCLSSSSPQCDAHNKNNEYQLEHAEYSDSLGNAYTLEII